MSRFANHFNQMAEDERQFALRRVISSLSDGILETLLLELQPEQRHINKLHGLLTESVWMEAHIVEDGHYRNFLNEVQLAWQVADKVGETIEPMRSEMIARQVRYALLQTSMNSLSANIHPDTLAFGLQTGLWDEETALTYAKSVRFGMTKVTMLAEIAAFLHTQQKDEQTQEVFMDTVAAMREIDHQSDYVKALIALIQHLPPDLLTDALAMTQEIADRDDRARVLSSLAPHLSAELLEEALEVARDIGNADSRANALRGFAPCLPNRAPHLLNRFFQIVRDLHGDGNRARILIASAPYLSSDAIIEALKIVQSMYDPCYRIAVLLAFHLYEDSEKRFAAAQKALFIAREAHDIEDRAKGIALLAPYLPEELLPEAFTIARTIGDGEPYDAAYRTEALVALAPRLPDELQAEMIAEVQRWNIFFFTNSSEVLAALIPHLSPHLFPTMLALARSIIQEVYASEKMAHTYVEDQVPRVLVTLFPRLPHELLPDALVTIEDIDADMARGYALTQLAPVLPEEFIPKALSLVRELKAVHRVRPLLAFVKRGFQSLLEETLRSAQQIQEADNSTGILPGLLVASASVFPPEMRSSVMDEAVKLTSEIDDAYYQAEALIALVAHLDSERVAPVLQNALQAAKKIPYPQLRFSILHKIIALLPSEQRLAVIDDALQTVQEELGEDEQDYALARVMVMSLLAPFLSDGQREQVRVAAKKMRDPIVRSRSLVALAFHSSPTERSLLLKEALKSARRIKDEERGERFEALVSIALCLADQQKHSVFVEALQAAKKVSKLHRPELGTTLAQLFSELPPDLLPAAASLARQFWSPQALTALISCVPPEERPAMLNDALEAIRQVKSGLERARLLAISLPYATPDQQSNILNEALDAIQQVEPPIDWSRFSQVVWSLASFWAQLPQQRAYDLWVSVLHTYARYRRAYFLAALAGLFQVIAALGGPPAITESIQAVLEICCHWSWSYRGA